MSGIIIAGMKVPKNCAECKINRLYNNGFGTRCPFMDDNNRPIERGSVESYTDRHKNCPMKSSEGLIEKIESYKDPTKPECQFDAALNLCVKIIKEYCGGNSNEML